MAAAAAAAEVNALLARCGVVVAGHQNQFGSAEGVQAPEDFGMLTVNDIPELAKRMQGRHAAQRVVLGVAQIKKLQALVWWCRDRIRRGKAIVVVDFDDDAMQGARSNSCTSVCCQTRLLFSATLAPCGWKNSSGHFGQHLE
jgi:hypothetical protein